MRRNAESWAQMVLAHEGGYVNDPHDPGGRTKYGVTQKTLDRVRDKMARISLPLDVKDLTKPQAKSIYRFDYWAPIFGDQLPSGIDIAVADMAINQGVARAVEALQRAVRSGVDGAMGPNTMAAVEVTPIEQLLVDFHAYRAQDYAQLSDDLIDRYGYGWYRRMLRTMLEAKALLV